MNHIKSIWNRYYNQGAERSVKAKRNILYMLFIKGANILIGFLLVPITLNYVDSETYGIWMTLSTMIAWISFFDIGINNGLKNKLAEAFVHKDYKLCRKYISTTYAILTLIFSVVMVLLLAVTPYLDWPQILHLPAEYSEVLIYSICILIVYFCLNFVLSTINVILTADQRPADAAFRTFVQQALSLLIIYILTLTTEGSLLNLCLGLCAAPIIVVLLFNITLFQGRYHEISPSFSSIDFCVAPELMGLGVKFFIIQIAGVIQYQLVNFILLRYYGGSSVTEYNIAFKYFSALNMVWTILITPLWVGFTDAIANSDYDWIRKTLKRYLYLYILASFVGLIMLIVSPYIYKLWVGDMVHVEFGISLWTFVYTIAWMLSGIYVSFINGSGKVQLQTYLCLITPIVFLLVALYAVKNGLPFYYIIIASILSNVYGVLIAPIQAYHILYGIEHSNSLSR